MKTHKSILMAMATLLIFSSSFCDIDQSKDHYNIGDIGPAGGYIFYIRSSLSNNSWRYLEAASSDVSSSVWGTINHPVPGAEEMVPGTGRQNTLDIIAGDAEYDKAADRCEAYTSVCNGIEYDDWFLPSKHELDFMYENLKVSDKGGFSDGIYWSSTEDDDYDAWCVNFFNGDDYRHLKSFVRNVRPVRAF